MAADRDPSQQTVVDDDDDDFLVVVIDLWWWFAMIGDCSTTVIELWMYNHLRKSTKPVYKNQSISRFG